MTRAQAAVSHPLFSETMTLTTATPTGQIAGGLSPLLLRAATGKDVSNPASKMKRHFYAELNPRGLAHEINVYRFKTKADRDAWVAEILADEDVISAGCNPRAVSAKQARSDLGKHNPNEAGGLTNGFFEW